MIFEKVQQIISEQLGTDVDDITLESNIVDDLDADSLDVIEMLMMLEEEFDIEIPDKDLDDLNTVGDVVEYIKTNR